MFCVDPPKAEIIVRRSNMEVKKILRGVCPICQGNERYNRLAEHFQSEHPEYQFTNVFKHTTSFGTRGNTKQVCKLCIATCSGFDNLIRHYELRHPEALKPGATSFKRKANDLYKLTEVEPENTPESIGSVIAGLVKLLEEARTERDMYKVWISDLEKQIDVLNAKCKELTDKNAALLKGSINDKARIIEARELLARENNRLH